MALPRKQEKQLGKENQVGRVNIFFANQPLQMTLMKEGIWKIKLPDGLEILTIQRNQGQLLHGKNDPFSLNPAMKLIEQVTIFFSIILSSLDYRIRWGKVSKAGNSRGWVGRSSKEGQSSKKRR